MIPIHGINGTISNLGSACRATARTIFMAAEGPILTFLMNLGLSKIYMAEAWVGMVVGSVHRAVAAHMRFISFK